ncbi:STAG-domain-containing protein [Rhizodiscina lignyota]|uniref:STAG-domain-containing protein n=1 Tax=Rhizodiscina lignyota TaxID=1504668 RepID=A0A9P4MDX5_9PEZI|nr:STAG-domain-containing protein [Rhizodiscina lignyota]
MDDESEEEDDESEGEPDEEELREKKRRATRKKTTASAKQPRAKKAKPSTNGETMDLAIRPAVGQKRKTGKKRAQQDATAEEAGGIYADVFARDETLDNASAEWIGRFKEHESMAISEIFNFVLKCAGCDIKVDQHDAADPDHFTDKLRDIQEEYQAQNVTDYPIIARGKASTTFRNTMEGFFHCLVQALATSSLLYDQPEIMENIESWVSTMSSAGNRPFRHTATAAALAIVSALCQLGKDIVDTGAKTRRLGESEKKKSRINKGRVKELDGNVKESEKKRETIDQNIQSWFEAVFVHRYRDVDPRIRVDCVQALSGWILTYPELFSDSTYLRYLGWVLSDTNAPTRLEVVKQVQKMFKDKDNVGRLKTFTERFRARIVEMATRDAEPNVRSSAVELLDTLRDAGLLEPDDIDSVGRLIFDSELRVRKAVVPFFVENINDMYNEKVEELGGEEALEDASGEDDDDFDRPRLEWIKLKCLVEMLQSYDAEEEPLPSQVERWPGGSGYSLIASGIESRPSVAAQALYSQMPEIQKWEVLAGYLLYDHSQPTQNGAASGDAETLIKSSCQLDEKEEVLLLEVLNAAVKLGLTQTMEATADKKTKKTKKEREQAVQLQETAALHLASLIPRLLKKFGAQPEAASAVLRLEHVLNLEIFQELRQDSTTYAALLDDINKQFLTHGSESVLAEASAALLHARRFDELGEVTEGKVQALWQDTTNALHSLIRNKDVAQRGSLNRNVLTGLSNTVLRISKLASISDCIEAYEAVPTPRSAGRSKKARSQRATDEPEPPAVDVLIDILNRGIPTADSTPETDVLEDALVTNAIKAVLFYFLWKIKAWQGLISSNTTVPFEDVESLAAREDNFMTRLTQILKKRKGADEIRLAAAGSLLDLHCAFATLRQARRDRNQATQTGDDWAALVMEVHVDTQVTLRELLGAAERIYAKKSSKKLEDGVEAEDEPLTEDEDPQSDEEEEDEEDEARKEEKMQGVLIAEQRLCELASKIVMGIIAGVVDGSQVPRLPHEDDDAAGPMRKRLERNKARLGPNFKQVAEFLNEEKKQNAKALRAAKAAKSKAKGNAEQAKRTLAAKSKGIIDVEDDEDEEMGDGEDEDAQRERALLEEDEAAAEDEDGVDVDAAGAGAQDEAESVLGD